MQIGQFVEENLFNLRRQKVQGEQGQVETVGQDGVAEEVGDVVSLDHVVATG